MGGLDRDSDDGIKDESDNSSRGEMHGLLYGQWGSTVEVTAGSLFEAAALGLEAFAAAELTESRPAPATILEIVATPVPVTHRVRVSQLKEWLNGAAKSPREQLLKQRVKGRVRE